MPSYFMLITKFCGATHILMPSLRNTNAATWSIPGRKEQNQRDLKKDCANCYQLDTFFKGIRKTVNESENSFSKNQNRSWSYK